MSDERVNIKGVLNRILSYSERKGVIFILIPLASEFGDGIKVKINKKIASRCPVPCIGQIWEITGLYDKIDTYGEQIIAEAAQIALPTGKGIVDFLVRNPEFTGIGVKTTKKLWATFGEDLYEILSSQNVSKLINKVNLSETVIRILFEKWNAYKETIQIVKFLDTIKFPSRVAWKARELWGSDVQGYITEDPYRLLALGEWKQVDKCARKYFSISHDSKFRYIAAVESALYDAYDDKHTAQPHKELLERVQDILNEKNVETAISLALADKRICTTVDTNNSPIYRVTGARIIEDYVESRILEIENEALGIFEESLLHSLESSLSFKLVTDQREAIKMVLEKPFAIILGGPGVGKKTILKCVYSMLPRDAVIMQIALTIHTAKQLHEITSYDAVLMSKLLELAKNSELPENLYLFIHEASALDVPTFYQILQALPTGTRLYLIGDSYQLPPNGPGLILHKLVMDQYPYVTTLKNVLDSSETNNIAIIADAIKTSRQFKLAEFVSGKSKGFGVSLLSTDEKDLNDALIYTYRELSEAGDTQIIAAKYETYTAINAVLHFENISLREYRNLSLETIFGKNVELTLGDKIIYTGRTDRVRSLFNGAVGTLTEIYKHPVIITSESNASIVFVAKAHFNTTEQIQLTEEDLNYIDLGYCIILNESNFGRWERVIIASEFVEDSTDLIDNRWFYTAVTRSEKQCVIVGSLDNFNFHVSKPFRSITRYLGLNFKRPIIDATDWDKI